MVRIRKKTSKVLPLKKRHRIKQKVKEGERKKKKLAKKNPQWKSRVPKDPGVPNNFPFKDEIIAEAQEARNTAEEEQQRQREMQRQRALSTDEINQLSGITIIEQKPKPYAYVDPELDDSDDEEAPTLIDHDLLDLDAVLNKADVILQVLDARDPASHRVPSLEKSVAERGKKLIFILHKIDLVPREATSSWLSYLRAQHPAFPFRSASAFLPLKYGEAPKPHSEDAMDDELGSDALRDCLSTLAKSKSSEPLSVAIVGLPNSGKSSLINSLIHEPLLAHYKLNQKATAQQNGAMRTTVYPRAIQHTLPNTNTPIVLIDTPGFSFTYPSTLIGKQKSEYGVKEMLLKRRGQIEKTKDGIPAAHAIISRTNHDDLAVLYNTPSLPTDPAALLTAISRATKQTYGAGIPDLKHTAGSILRDWRTGKIGIYTMPPNQLVPSPNKKASSDFADLYTRTDADTLEKLQTKVEMVSGPFGTTVVRFKSGEPWMVDVDMAWRYNAGEVATGNGKKRKQDLEEDDDDEDDSEEDDSDQDSDDSMDYEDEEEFTGFGSPNSESDSDSDRAPSQPSKRKAHPTPTTNDRTKKQKHVAFAKQPLPPANSTRGPKKDDKPSKTALKAQARAEAIARSHRPSTAKTSKPTPVKESKPIKVANTRPAKPKPTGTTADPSEQPYDFSAHFK